jgi:hypothetical protein
MLANLQILIFCNAISYSPGRLSLFIFCTYLQLQFFNWAKGRAEEYKFPAQQAPLVMGQLNRQYSYRLVSEIKISALTALD